MSRGSAKKEVYDAVAKKIGLSWKIYWNQAEGGQDTVSKYPKYLIDDFTGI